MEPLPLCRNSKPARIQTNRIRPAGTVVTNHPPEFGDGERRGLLRIASAHEIGISFRRLSEPDVPPHFVAPTEPDRKTTTLRQQISRVASVQRVSISPTSSPEGTTKLSDTIRWRSHSALGVANSPEPGHVTAFRDTPPSRADRRSFVYILGPATVGQTRAFCPEHMGTCMGCRACQARQHASRVLSPPCVHPAIEMARGARRRFENEGPATEWDGSPLTPLAPAQCRL